MSTQVRLSDDDFARLLRFRDGLRQFLRWSEAEARASGLTPAQHQLLLVVRAHEGGSPSIGDIAEHLLLRHHSVVELVDRAADAGLVERHVDDDNHRVVRISLTSAGSKHLNRLSAAHLEELSRWGPLRDLFS